MEPEDPVDAAHVSQMRGGGVSGAYNTIMCFPACAFGPTLEHNHRFMWCQCFDASVLALLALRYVPNMGFCSGCVVPALCPVLDVCHCARATSLGDAARQNGLRNGSLFVVAYVCCYVVIACEHFEHFELLVMRPTEQCQSCPADNFCRVGGALGGVLCTNTACQCLPG